MQRSAPVTPRLSLASNSSSSAQATNCWGFPDARRRARRQGQHHESIHTNPDANAEGPTRKESKMTRKTAGFCASVVAALAACVTGGMTASAGTSAAAPPARQSHCKSDGPDRDRTCDLGIKSPAQLAATNCGELKALQIRRFIAASCSRRTVRRQACTHADTHLVNRQDNSRASRVRTRRRVSTPSLIDKESAPTAQCP